MTTGGAVREASLRKSVPDLYIDGHGECFGVLVTGLGLRAKYPEGTARHPRDLGWRIRAVRPAGRLRSVDVCRVTRSWSRHRSTLPTRALAAASDAGDGATRE